MVTNGHDGENSVISHARDHSGSEVFLDVAPANPYAQGCPSRRILDLIGGKWTVLIVGVLGEGTARFSELQRRIDGISQKMLTQTLRELEHNGLVERSVYAEVPPRVEYRLTDSGTTLMAPLKALEVWSITNFGLMLEAQGRDRSAD